jgi:hypothetical protein
MLDLVEMEVRELLREVRSSTATQRRRPRFCPLRRFQSWRRYGRPQLLSAIHSTRSTKQTVQGSLIDPAMID